MFYYFSKITVTEVESSFYSGSSVGLGRLGNEVDIRIGSFIILVELSGV